MTIYGNSGKLLRHVFHDTDDPMTIFSRFWITIEYFHVTQELLRYEFVFIKH